MPCSSQPRLEDVRRGGWKNRGFHRIVRHSATPRGRLFAAPPASHSETSDGEGINSNWERISRRAWMGSPKTFETSSRISRSGIRFRRSQRRTRSRRRSKSSWNRRSTSAGLLCRKATGLEYDPRAEYVWFRRIEEAKPQAVDQEFEAAVGRMKKLRGAGRKGGAAGGEGGGRRN